jgi:hypothetical protein
LRYTDKKIYSVSDFLDELRRRRLGQPIWYRGQAKAGWSLEPTIARISKGILAESPLVTRFKQNALALVAERPASEWEWLFVMRHHGVPTRLMDWSESPLVGLYFAVSGHPKSDGAVWNLLPIELNRVASITPQHPSEIPGFGDANVLNNYLPSSLANEQTSSLSPAAAIAPRNTRRMQAQYGVFTITHRKQTPIDDVGDKNHVWRLIVPKSAKSRIKSELAVLNISPLSLFPELDHVAVHATESLG